MKNSLLIGILLVLTSCMADSKTMEKEKIQSIRPQVPEIDSAILDSKQVFGKWGIYETTHNGLSINCNACPEISFNRDLTGEIIKPSSEKEPIQWTTDGRILTIKNLETSPDKTIADGKYAVTFSEEKKSTELRLTNQMAGVTYTLRK